METATGMDVAWCLTCSKSTRDARNPYCSEVCRLADCDSGPSSSFKLPLTSPVPAALYSSPGIRAFDRRRSSASPTKATPPRPQFASRATNLLPPSSEAAFSPPKILAGIPRDRRAFSFPSAPNSPPLLFPTREHRGSTTLPPFARRDIIANMTPKSPGLGSVKEDGMKFPQILARRLAKSTGGANTPGTAAESVFLSTSESSEDEEDLPARLPPAIPAPPPRAISGPGASTQFSTLRSQLSLGRTNSLQSRSTSTSPVAAMVASSASSRSREDIISWAKAIDRRNGAEHEEEDMSRGRPRAMRVSSLAKLAPPSTEPLDEDAEDELLAANDGVSTGMGSTPKGRIGSALAGLSGYGMGSIVKALTSVTASPHRAATVRRTTTTGRPGASTSDFAVAPSPAEVAKVDVVASTMPLDDASSHYIAGTATLSTISFSEAIDPSVIGTTDQVEIATDDGGLSASSSGYVNRRYRTLPSRKDSIASVPPPVPERQQRPAPNPRPITSTIWNLSSYLTRFSPFALTSAISPYTPFATQRTRPIPHTQTSSSSAVPSLVSSAATATPDDPATAPLPAVRSRPDTPESPAQQMVRSVPMDIAMPVYPIEAGTKFHEQPPHLNRERLRSSRSRARSRSRRRSRSRSSSAGRLADAGMLPLAQLEDMGKGVGMSDQDPDADADVSEGEEESSGRGREGGRDRGRGRTAEEDRERGRGRGRDRSVKVI